MRRTHVVIVLVGLLASAAALWLILSSDHEKNGAFTAAANLAVAWAFIGSGLVAWARRPDNRFGLLMTVVGLTWFFGALNESNDPYLFSLGSILGGIGLAVFVHALLAFPRGYLETRFVWAIVVVAYALALVAQPLYEVFDEGGTCAACPGNVLSVTDSQTGRTIVGVFAVSAAAFVILGSFSVLSRRWRAASAPLRRQLAPVFAAAASALTLAGVGIVVSFGSEDVSDIIRWLALAAFSSVPLAFLAGLLRTRLARAGVTNLVVELGQARAPGQLRDALRRALGDPTLRLAYWLPDRRIFVDTRGRPLTLPEEGEEQVATRVERGDSCVGALIHDRALREDPALVNAVVAAAGLALENERRLVAFTEEEARNRALLDALPDLMFRMRGDGTYLDFNGDPDDLASPPEELIGSKVDDVLPQDVAEKLLAYVREALSGVRVSPLEYRLELRGERRDFEARASVSGEEEVVLIVRDVSERNRLHRELGERSETLERERDFIRAVVDNAPSFFCLVDPEGRIVRFNRTLEEASGFRDDERTRGQALWDVFIVPAEREAVRREFKELVVSARSGEYENRWLTAGDELLTVAWSMTPLADESGQPHFLVSGMDITERKRHEQELRDSRARIVEVGEVERRRLERNLHDGAQQRLVSLSLVLRLAQAKLADDPAGARDLLGSAADELAQALEELRELARGIHPAVLSDRGLKAALEALAARSAVPVDVATTEDRLPPQVEAAAYYVVSEALANIVKYAEASSVAVSISRMNGAAVVEVSDDGVGGADPTRGSGLRGLADRVEALDGRLRVQSPPGEGTKIRAEIPCG